MAGKPLDVIQLSNGFPSGDHFNLNIHGKKLDYHCTNCELCTDPETCDPLVLECNVINIPEYTSEDPDTDNTISYVSGKKVKIDALTVFDSCTESFDTTPAEVWLPYEEQGFFVFARALGKPPKKDETARRIILENIGLEAYSLGEDVSDPDDVYNQFEMDMALGLITKNATYKMSNSGENTMIRFDSEPEGKGKGKTLGKNITDMFLWTGFAFDPSLDLNEDTVVDELDVEYACWSGYDADGDGVITDTDLDNSGLEDLTGDALVDRWDLALADPCIYDQNSNGVIDEWDGIYDSEDPNEPVYRNFFGKELYSETFGCLDHVGITVVQLMKPCHESKRRKYVFVRPPDSILSYFSFRKSRSLAVQTQGDQVSDSCFAGTHDSVSTSPVNPYRSIIFGHRTASEDDVMDISRHLPGIFGLENPLISHTKDA